MNDKMKAEFDAAFVKKFGFGRMMASANADAHQMLNAAEWAWETATAKTPPPAVQPVTMASVMRAYEYACDHPHKYLRGTSNWCAAVAWKLNQLESPAPTPPQPIYDEAVNAAVLGAQNLNAAMATIDILRAQLAERDALLTDLGVEPDGVSDVYQRLLLNAERYEYLREHMAVENFPSEHPDWSQPSEYESRRIDELCDSAMSRAKAGEDDQ